MWLCVCVGVLVIYVLVFTVFCIVCTLFCIASFMYNYSYLFCLYWCKDYCYRVTTPLQLVVVVVIIIKDIAQCNRMCVCVCVCSCGMHFWLGVSEVTKLYTWNYLQLSIYWWKHVTDFWIFKMLSISCRPPVTITTSLNLLTIFWLLSCCCSPISQKCSTLPTWRHRIL
jgi:hypothetical protein